jgi:hypothetical protein
MRDGGRTWLDFVGVPAAGLAIAAALWGVSLLSVVGTGSRVRAEFVAREGPPPGAEQLAEWFGEQPGLRDVRVSRGAASATVEYYRPGPPGPLPTPPGLDASRVRVVDGLAALRRGFATTPAYWAHAAACLALGLSLAWAGARASGVSPALRSGSRRGSRAARRKGRAVRRRRRDSTGSG